MEAPVNFDNLRDITGGDVALEADLLRLFLDSGNACLEKMREALIADDEVQWRQQAHAFKGTCMNLGATALSDFCAAAQADWRAVHEDKRVHLAIIEDEFQRVRLAIDSLATTGLFKA